ncbi:MAG TPA: peptidoglycan endopeptidase [Sphingomonas sp.]|jgi:hypothetical protein|uniref:peptidoglycan endopeptidase n=1 Tax=Sphingomonas sp. TaxID=28214 RepID=UPI002ED99373
MGEAVVARARACIGVRFRPQGRDPAFGLDCVGLIAVAGAVPPGRVPARYAMRGGTAAAIIATIGQAGLRRIMVAEPGDVMLAEAGPRQFHLLMSTDIGFVHADAGIGRVVEVPGAVPWPVLAMWRFGED